MEPPIHPVRVALLTALVVAALPAVWVLGGCLGGTTAGAGLAVVVTPEEAAQTEGPTLSVKDDKFAGVRITRLQRNLLPDPTGAVIDEVHFDGVCIDEACHAVLEVTRVAPMADEFRRMHLVVDGVVFKNMRGKPSVNVDGYAIEGTLVVPLKVEAMRAIIAAKEIEFRLEPKRSGERAVDLDGDSSMLEGRLSPENVLNLREMLSLARVDPWAMAEEVDDRSTPRTEPTVGSPPPRKRPRNDTLVGSPPR